MAGPEALELTATSNPYLSFYREFVNDHPRELTTVFDPKLSDEVRSEMYSALDVGVAMVRFVDCCVFIDLWCSFFFDKRMRINLQKYSWAIPDERALQIIKHYGPVSC